MVNKKGVNIGHPSKDRPGRDPDLCRLKSIGPRQMRWDDFSVNVVIVVLKGSVQQHWGLTFNPGSEEVWAISRQRMKFI